MTVTDADITAMHEEYQQALGSLSPAQAWAVRLNREITIAVNRQLAKLSDDQYRKLRAKGEIDSHVAKLYAEQTAIFVNGAAVSASVAPAEEFATNASFAGRHQQIKAQIAAAYPEHRVRESFCHGLQTYVQVMRPNYTCFVVVVDGDKITPVFR